MTRLLAMAVLLVFLATACAGSADDDVDARTGDHSRLEQLMLEHESSAVCNGSCVQHVASSVQCSGPGKEQSTWVFYRCDVDYEHLGDEATSPTCVALDSVSETGYFTDPERDC